ncbi:hypothetical protein Gogos_018512, partial [Gossypium gossypioides]|nr:hypothetical protein [Gossypium gossypioides]
MPFELTLEVVREDLSVKKKLWRSKFIMNLPPIEILRRSMHSVVAIAQVTKENQFIFWRTVKGASKLCCRILFLELILIRLRNVQAMGYCKAPCVFLLCLFISFCLPRQLLADEVDKNLTAQLFIDASEQSSRPIPQTLFGIFFEEINHAGAGGLWAELVSNRGSKCVPFGRGLDIGGCVGDGFEAGGANIPSNIDPWSIIGDESSIIVSTDRSSCFERNKVALKMEVLCNSEDTHICPSGGVGIYNPGFWGMNIEQGKSYKIVFYVRSTGAIDISVSFTSSDGLQTLSSTNIKASASDVSNWTKMEVLLEAKETNHNSRLQLTTSKNGVVWFDQVSAMPLDTYK